MARKSIHINYCHTKHQFSFNVKTKQRECKQTLLQNDISRGHAIYVRQLKTKPYNREL